MTRSNGSLFYKPKSRAEIIRKKRWDIPIIILNALKRACMVIGAVVLISAFLAGFLSGAMRRSGPVMPSDMILTLNLEHGIGERPMAPSFANPFPFRQPTVRQVVDTIERAAEDDRVQSLLVKMDMAGVSLAHIEEIRPAIAAFRAAGKTTKMYASSYSGMGSGLGTFYLASAFDEIWMQPVGMVSFSGIAFDVPFARDALNKLGIGTDFFQREKYKNAMESFTARAMSPESRETFEDIADDYMRRILRSVAQDRDIEPLRLRELMDTGLLTGPEALEAGLIDRLDYADVLVSETRTELGFEADSAQPEMVSLSRYAGAVSGNFGFGKETVALIYASGAIMPSAQGRDGTAAADEISGALNSAAEDESIAAIILRVDSPGGSPSASETIRRAVIRAKDKGKKVIVSMGPVAASGGYWIAADADHIFALPSTLTGSIGVVMGKFELSGLWDKVGVNWETVQRGENAQIWSINRPFDAKETERINDLIDHTYEAFIERVAQGRELSENAVRDIAKGRVWTGQDALGNGLVDSLGGLNAALDYTAHELGLESRADLKVTELPKPQSAVEQLAELLGAQVALSRFMAAFLPYQEQLQSILNLSRMRGANVYDASAQELR